MKDNGVMGLGSWSEAAAVAAVADVAAVAAVSVTLSSINAAIPIGHNAE